MPTQSPITALAEAIVEELNSSTAFTIPFKAVRRYLPVKQLEELDAITVSVFPRSLDKGLDSRSQIANDVGVSIGFQKRVRHADNETLDPLVDLVDAIANSLTAVQFGNSMFWKDTEIVLYNEKLLDEASEFRSLILLTFTRDDDI